ncbi:GNAT family N-acetyltransferase [Mitsuaria sp. GD03876]|uniref:GNAT family N-acetyltransferase n=1 Tax=Mitsuaria sp. GD03876 TaxID=2975399 RepID=UPI00244B1F2C|nr:GNAT family N-acetyltransferase [Mitsuaria sp. GD03876]MDH0866226.1 GNAT family N-acetyltransferase [Mitsuaria sp. GD03876]
MHTELPFIASYYWIEVIDARIAGQIVELVNSTVADGGTLGYERALTPHQQVQFIAGLRDGLASGRTHLLLGHVDGRPAFMALLHLNAMANCRHRAELAKGVVHPDFRGLRFVQLAFREITRRAERLGVEQLVLDVRENTRAHRLWQFFGFETYGVLDDYARTDGAVHRGHFMAQAVRSLRQRVDGAPIH